VKIISCDGLNSVIKEDNLMAVPCCEVELADSNYKTMYDSLLNFTVTKGKIEATDTLTELKNYVERYNSAE
jgi:hypothetical protein